MLLAPLRQPLPPFPGPVRTFEHVGWVFNPRIDGGEETDCSRVGKIMLRDLSFTVEPMSGRALPRKLQRVLRRTGNRTMSRDEVLDLITKSDFAYRMF